MTPDRALLLAEAYVRMGRGARALEVLQDAAPEDALTWLWRANALHILERYEEALAAARTGLGLDPESPWLYSALGRAELALRHLREADTALRESLRLDPYQAETHSILAAVLVSMNRHTEAEAASRRAMELADEPSVRALDIFVKLATGWHETADDRSKELLADAPDPLAHFCRGIARATRGDARAAARHYREAARLQPDNRTFVNAARVSNHWLLWPLRLTSPVPGVVATLILIATLQLQPKDWPYVLAALAFRVYVVIAGAALVRLPWRK